MNVGQDFAKHKSFPRDTQGIALDARPEVVLCPNGALVFYRPEFAFFWDKFQRRAEYAR